MFRTLGIDLGTTNSVMAQLRRGDPEIIHNADNSDTLPSVVGLGRRKEPLVGRKARDRMLLDPENVIRSAKRFMGRKFHDAQVQAVLDQLDYRVSAGSDGDVAVELNGRTYTPIEIAAIVLRRLKEDAEQRAGARFDRAVITVPAYFGERQVAATQEAGRLAGFHVLRIINEPTAAALAYGVTGDLGDEGRTVLVYDLGGGTFDISILLLVPGSISVLGIEGDNLLGGDDFDRAVAEALLEDVVEEAGPGYHAARRDRAALVDEAEKVKMQLSGALAADVTLVGLGGGQVTLESDFERSRFEELIEGRIERTIELTHKAIMEASLTVADVDEVLLVGGSTSIPLVARRLGEVFGPKRIRRGVNPMQCVALGAAVQSALVDEVECPECRASAPLEAEECPSCAASLAGGARVSCPTCFVPAPAEAGTCPKCAEPLDGSAVAATAAEPGALPATQPSSGCPRCGTPADAGAEECEVCGEPLGAAAARSVADEPQGLRCADCGTVNEPGAEECASCGALMTVVNPFDITPKNLGIELNDGRMAVIIPKNTSYPTTEPVKREFVVSGGTGQRLEVAVHEGEHEVAQQNELVGHLTMALPDGISGRTPVDVSFGVDGNRTISLTVRVHGGRERSVKLKRHTLDPERRVQVDLSRRKIEDFADKWESELTAAERQAAQKLMHDLDNVAEGETGGRSVDVALAEAEERLAAQEEIRYAQAYLSMLVDYNRSTLRTEDLEQLEDVLLRLERARESGDWRAALELAKRGLQFADALGPGPYTLTMCHVYADQGLVSPALAMRLRAELRALEEAQRSANMEESNVHMTRLMELYAAAARERGEQPRVVDEPVRPEEA